LPNLAELPNYWRLIEMSAVQILNAVLVRAPDGALKMQLAEPAESERLLARPNLPGPMSPRAWAGFIRTPEGFAWSQSIFRSHWNNNSEVL